MLKLLQIGTITGTHGIHGEVKVYPVVDDPSRFRLLKDIFLETDTEQLKLEVAGVKYAKQLVILKFSGLDSINDVEKYRGCSLFVTREDAVPLEDGEYYIADIIGASVVTEDGAALGTLKDVIETGANDVFTVAMPDGRELLLPAIKDCILDISPEDMRITVHMIPGLMDTAYAIKNGQTGKEQEQPDAD